MKLCREYPGSRWAIVRKDLPTLRKNTLPSLQKLLLHYGNFVGPLNQSTWTWTCINGSEIMFFPESFSKDPELNRWKGLEVNGFVLEEANELNESSAYKAIERAGSWIIPKTEGNPDPKQPPPLVLFTFNPCANWPRFWFYEPHNDETIEAPYYYLPSTEADNPYVTEAQRENWKSLPKEEYDRFVKGSWEFTEEPNQLIRMAWIIEAQRLAPDEEATPRLGVDPARYGNDKAVICRTNGNDLVRFWDWDKTNLDWLAEQVMTLAARPEDPVNSENIRIDTVGVGGGVADPMMRRGWTGIKSIEGGGSPWERKHTFWEFPNLRTQMCWEAREKLRTGQCSLPDDFPKALIADLLSITYRVVGEKRVEVSTKDEQKEVLGRSPDYGDSWMMAILDDPEETPPPPVRFRTIRI